MDGYFFDHTKHMKILSPEELMSKNRIICNPSDYVKLAESGVVKLMADAGVEVIQSELAEAGKMIATGAIAKSIMISEGKWKGE